MPFDFAPEKTDWYAELEDRVAYWLTYIRANPRKYATVDFETRSACDLKKHGSFVYSIHESTRAMCLAFHLPGTTEVGLWHMAHEEHLIDESEPPLELFAYVLAGGLVEAHNAYFERVIWANVMVARHGWPAVGHLQWRCSASRASAMSLPRSLDGASAAMGLGLEKDMAGNRLMLKMCKPRKPRKAEVEAWRAEHGKEPLPLLYHETEEDLYRLWEYCRNDVRAEYALSSCLPELSETELAVWQMDQAMNEHGARFDLDMARNALELAKRWKAKLNSVLEAFTGISSATKRQAVKDWLLEEEGLELPDTTADTLEHLLAEPGLSPRARRILQIVTDVNRTSTRKYQAMLDKASPDWRVRDLLMYHGAGTGRWAGKGVQVHNFPARDLIIKDFDEAAELILEGDLDWIVALYGDVMKLLSHALRGAIVASLGRDLMVADYSSIEARCLLWEADAQAALELFRTGGDIYCDMATGIYGFQVSKKDHPNERQFGKQAILGLGYGMGYLTFLLTCRKYNIHFSRAQVLGIMGAERLAKAEEWVRKQLCLDAPPADMTPEQARKYSDQRRQAAKTRRRLVEAREDPRLIVHELALMKHTVDVYRTRYPQVKQMWTDQEQAAIQAVRERATVDAPVVCGKIRWYLSEARIGHTVEGEELAVPEGKWLHCELPSGRRMSYADPEVKLVKTSWGEDKPALRYMSVNGVTRKWERTATYGGKVVENITQAVARDIMANAMLLAHEGGTYDTIMSVHDELVAEVDEDKGSIEEYEELMSSIPPWAAGCPIAAEAERFKRYRK